MTIIIIITIITPLSSTTESRHRSLFGHVAHTDGKAHANSPHWSSREDLHGIALHLAQEYL